MTAQRPNLSFDRIADRYDKTRGGEHRGRSVAADLHALLRPGEPVLDIGIGTGTVAVALRDLAHRVVGVDLSPAMLRHAYARLGPVVAAADAARLPLRDGATAQAISVWVLHLVGDVPGVLREVARVLVPGGRYLVVPAASSPSPDEVSLILRNMAERLDPGRPRHDRGALLAAATAAGLELVETAAGTPDRHSEAPAGLADLIEARAFSNLWTVTDDQWRSVVMPVIAALRERPDADQPRIFHAPREILVFERRRLAAMPRPRAPAGHAPAS
jgi:SAM-dependent methyltransferase